METTVVVLVAGGVVVRVVVVNDGVVTVVVAVWKEVTVDVSAEVWVVVIRMLTVVGDVNVVVRVVVLDCMELNVVGEVRVVVFVVVLIWRELIVVGRVKVCFNVVVTRLTKTLVRTLVTVLVVGRVREEPLPTLSKLMRTANTRITPSTKDAAKTGPQLMAPFPGVASITVGSRA